MFLFSLPRARLHLCSPTHPRHCAFRSRVPGPVSLSFNILSKLPTSFSSLLIAFFFIPVTVWNHSAFLSLPYPPSSLSFFQINPSFFFVPIHFLYFISIQPFLVRALSSVSSYTTTTSPSISEGRRSQSEGQGLSDKQCCSILQYVDKDGDLFIIPNARRISPPSPISIHH